MDVKRVPKPRVSANATKNHLDNIIGWQSYTWINNTCYINSFMEILYHFWLDRQMLWEPLARDFTPGGGLETVTRSFRMRELATGKDAAKRINAARDLVINYVVNQQNWFAPGELGNWSWFERMVDAEPEETVKRFFCWTAFETRECPVADHRQASRLRYKVAMALSNGYVGSVERFITTERLCWSANRGSCSYVLNDGNLCGSSSTVSREIANLPTMLIVDIGVGIGEGCWDLPFSLTLREGSVYDIIGRLFSTHPQGVHFFAKVNHPANRIAGHPAGIYTYNDMANKGRSMRDPAEGGFLGKEPLGILAIYRLRTGRFYRSRLQFSLFKN